MSHSVTKQATRFGVILLLATLAATAVTTSPAEAQLTVYKVEGVVYSPHFQPLKDAAVVLYTTAGAKAGTATTDASGKYSIASLQSGTYNLSVSDACCPTFWVPIQVSGTDPTVQQNVVLGANEGQGPLVLKGIAKGEADGKPLAGVRLEMWNYPSMGDEPYVSYYRESQQTSITADDGSYSFNVEPGSVNINARLDGYETLHASFSMDSSRSVDLPMRQASQSVATISGTVKGTDGKAVPNAYVSVQPDYECNDDVCMTTARPVQSGGASSSGDVSYWYEPAGQQYASTQTDSNGKYSLQVAPGRLVLMANAQDHVENRTTFTAEEGQSKTIDMVLERLPPDSVRVKGIVLDAATGKPVPFAFVNLENQRWGHWNSTMTKEDGTFELYTKPGYTIVTVSAEQYYWVPCAYEEKAAADSYAIAPGEPYPCPDGGQKTRAQSYYSKVIILGGDEASHDLEIELRPRPMPTAELKGYVVNASSDQAIPGVQVHFYNEFTRDWGTATTDEFGSFRIKVHGGYYTVRAYAEHYFDGGVNVEVKDGESKRVDVELTPGEKRYGGGCCWAYASDMSYAGKAEGASGAPQATYAAGAPAMASASSEAQASGDGAESYKGEGGSLGPYQPFVEDGGKATSPGAGVGLLIASVLALAWVRRRNG